MELPEKTVVLQLPEKATYFRGSTKKNGNLGEGIVQRMPFVHAQWSGVACGKGARFIERTSGTDKGQTEQKGRVPDSLYGFFEEVAVWRCECFVFLFWWSAHLKLHVLPPDGVN